MEKYLFHQIEFCDLWYCPASHDRKWSHTESCLLIVCSWVVLMRLLLIVELFLAKRNTHLFNGNVVLFWEFMRKFKWCVYCWNGHTVWVEWFEWYTMRRLGFRTLHGSSICLPHHSLLFSATQFPLLYRLGAVPRNVACGNCTYTGHKTERDTSRKKMVFVVADGFAACIFYSVLFISK